MLRGASAAPQRGQGGSKRPASRSAARRGPGPDEPVLGAGVAALAVDDHARREHEPAGEPRAGELAQQDRGAEVVVRDVVGDVADVGAEADHRRLVADVVDPAQRRRDGRAVAHVAATNSRRGIEVVGLRGVRGRQQRVEDAHVVAAARAARRRCASR